MTVEYEVRSVTVIQPSGASFLIPGGRVDQPPKVGDPSPLNVGGEITRVVEKADGSFHIDVQLQREV